MPKTSSPTEIAWMFSAPSVPMACTTPETSEPGMTGKVTGGFNSGCSRYPSRRYQSGGFTPIARTRTSTSPGPASGIGTFS